MSFLVVNDPGHGGPDPGNVNNGYREKDITLSTGHFFRKALERCGVRVIMTRTDDRLPLPNGTIGQDLSYRASIANRNNADLFVSWHNDSASPSAHGVAVWIHPAAAGTETERIARMIVDVIAAATGQFNRGVRYNDYAVLRETKMHAVLIEAGFLSNTDEARKLADPAFQRKQAEAAAKAICQYFGVAWKEEVKELNGGGEYKMTKEDANKIIALLGQVWNMLPDADEEGKDEIHRLANELRKASGQPVQ